jgi:hypothetical protein
MSREIDIPRILSSRCHLSKSKKGITSFLSSPPPSSLSEKRGTCFVGHIYTERFPLLWKRRGEGDERKENIA